MRDIVLQQLRDIGIESNMYHGGMGLFYLKWAESQLFEYVNVDYLSNSYKTRSQMYVFTYSGMTIS